MRGMTKRFFDALSDALAATGWSIPDLAARSGVSKDQITKFMQRSKKGVPASTNVDDAVKIAHAFGLTLDEMIQDDTAQLRSEAVLLWQSLTQGERDLLRAAARGQRETQDQGPPQ
ncbi:helix-turn-helix domain-containing protein (plasmid) [Paracoccus sp. TD-10]|uniref:helix-turn-helix domain-containing protein n=1 Tax=Paracoccus sp. TD-10 TaxID=3395918 RepID=UPI003AADC43A